MDGDFLLIRKMKNGDEAAMEQFVRKYYAPILKYCLYHTSSKETAEDITQETFEHFFASFLSYRHIGKLANYLYVIAGNLCRDSYKKRTESSLEELQTEGKIKEVSFASEFASETENQIDLQTGINKLPEELREVIILHYFQELKLREAAEILGISLPLVKYRVKRAKDMLNDWLKEG